MSTAPTPAPDPASKALPAGLGRRLAAYVLDVPIALIISLIPSIITVRALRASESGHRRLPGVL